MNLHSKYNEIDIDQDTHSFSDNSSLEEEMANEIQKKSKTFEIERNLALKLEKGM